MSPINRDFFFSQIRKVLFEGELRESQVTGLNAILDGWEKGYADQDDRWLAYALATTYHETDQHMEPIEEYGRGHGHAYGEPDPATGRTYYGRGFVQLTWKYNYEALGKKIGVDLVNDPELALSLPNATRILFLGMIEGIFTGRKLGDYFNAKTADWVDARRIINRLDKANAIANYGRDFYAAISYTK